MTNTKNVIDDIDIKNSLTKIISASNETNYSDKLMDDLFVIVNTYHETNEFFAQINNMSEKERNSATTQGCINDMFNHVIDTVLPRYIRLNNLCVSCGVPILFNTNKTSFSPKDLDDFQHVMKIIAEFVSEDIETSENAQNAEQDENNNVVNIDIEVSQDEYKYMNIIVNLINECSKKNIKDEIMSYLTTLQHIREDYLKSEQVLNTIIKNDEIPKELNITEDNNIRNIICELTNWQAELNTNIILTIMDINDFCDENKLPKLIDFANVADSFRYDVAVVSNMAYILMYKMMEKQN